MKINTNRWNAIRYTFFAPIYDWIVYPVRHFRKRSLEALELKKGDKVLIVGAGTGLDLPYFPDGVKITATDITPEMVRRIQKRSDQLRMNNVEAMVMDGQNLQFDDNQFDAVVLHLILAVIPNPNLCISEVERVLKPGKKIAVYDKFVPSHKSVSILRKILNPVTNTLATDVTRKIEDIVAHTNLEIQTDTPMQFGGNFRMIQIQKPKD